MRIVCLDSSFCSKFHFFLLSRYLNCNDSDLQYSNSIAFPAKFLLWTFITSNYNTLVHREGKSVTFRVKCRNNYDNYIKNDKLSNNYKGVLLIINNLNFRIFCLNISLNDSNIQFRVTRRLITRLRVSSNKKAKVPNEKAESGV